MATKSEGKQAGRKGKIADRALGPAADAFGREVEPLGKEAGAVVLKVGRLLVSGLDGTVYGIGQVANWMRDAVAKRLSQIPPDRIVEPNPRIAVPATQALVYSMGDAFIREMYANLLAADMNADKKKTVHPGFVEIIKEMTPAEAKAMQLLHRQPHFEYIVKAPKQDKWMELAELMHEGVGVGMKECAIGLSNLQRLGLVEITGIDHVVVGPENVVDLSPNDLRGSRSRKVAIGKSRFASPQFGPLPTPPKSESLVSKDRDYFGGWAFENVRMPVAQNVPYGIHLTPMGRAFVDVCLAEL
jgi:hypothetical protein